MLQPGSYRSCRQQVSLFRLTHPLMFFPPLLLQAEEDDEYMRSLLSGCECTSLSLWRFKKEAGVGVGISRTKNNFSLKHRNRKFSYFYLY